MPYAVAQWMAEHPDQDPSDGLVLAQPWTCCPAGQQVKEMIYHQYRTEAAPAEHHVGSMSRLARSNVLWRTRRRCSGTDSSNSPTPRNRSIVNWEPKRALGWKGHITNLTRTAPT